MNKTLIRKNAQMKRSRGLFDVSKFIIVLLAKIAGIIIIIIFAAYICRYSYNFCYQIFGSVAVDEEGKGFTTSVTITDGVTLKQLSKNLEDKGLIIDKNSFYIKAKLDGVQIQSGSFILSSEMDYDEIFEMISISSDVRNGE
jgi:cell division protein YceG involved in septum cleavage